MCGRYYRRSDKQRIGDAFNIADLPSSLVISEDYNVAPTTFQPSSGMRRKPASVNSS
jgi:putative SOS response-associated peptidase YedK